VTRASGNLIRQPVGHNRRLAERALSQVKVQEDEGSYLAPQNITFAKWADDWHAGLRRPKENTRRSYTSTLDYAKAAFAAKHVRELRVPDIDRFLSMMPATISDSTRAKHLRVLGACLEAAVPRGYAAENPVRRLPKEARPSSDKREAGYFTNDELSPLIAAITEPLYRTLFLVALKTGMRQGELIALTWGDVDLANATIRVRRIYTRGIGLTAPKSKRSRRDVHVTADVVDLLGRWWGERGNPTDDQLVFPALSGGGYLSKEALTKQLLYPAMKNAGVPRIGPTGADRTWHSIRHTFARLAVENGRSISWLSRQLGHSTTAVTIAVYEHFEETARKAEAELMTFPV
jgi:integrase